jgi:hypothetical protein
MTTYQGLVPRVLWVTGYDPISRYDRFPLAAYGWGTNHPIMDKAPPLLSEEEGSPI